VLDIGDVHPITMNIRDSTGTLISAGTVVVTVTDPAGTVTTPAVTNPSTGVYVANFTCALPGLHSWRATAAAGGSLTIAQATTDIFHVSNATARLPMVNLAETKEHLRLSAVKDDEKLRRYILTGCALVEGEAGRVWTRRTVVDTFNLQKVALRLRTRPAMSITSVVDNGVTLPPTTGYTLSAGGVLYYGNYIDDVQMSGNRQNRFIGPTVVTYVAAEPSGIIPETIRMAALEEIRHLWETQSGGKGSLSQGELDPNTASQFAIPWRVKSLIESTPELGVSL
jgi:hypothetical protein